MNDAIVPLASAKPKAKGRNKAETALLSLLALAPMTAALAMDIHVFDLRIAFATSQDAVARRVAETIDREAFFWLLGLGFTIFVLGLPFGHWRHRADAAIVTTLVSLAGALFMTSTVPWPETAHEYALRFMTSPISWLCLPVWLVMTAWFTLCTVQDGFRRLNGVDISTPMNERRAAVGLSLMLATVIFVMAFFVGYVGLRFVVP